MTASAANSLLVGSNVIAFLPGVSREDRVDILDALLWAELSASDRYSREKKWEQWIDAYKAQLVGSGFTSRSPLSQKPVKVSNESGFRKEVAKLVRTINPPQLAGVAKSALDVMFNSDHARSFFSSWFNFNAGRSDNFQIVPCERGASGEINIGVCGLLMVTRTRLKHANPFVPQWPFAYEMP